MTKNLLLLAGIFIAAQATSQNLEWARAWGGTSDDHGKGIDVDSSGNVYSIGDFTDTVDFDPGPAVFTMSSTSGSAAFVSKFDAAGNFLWAVQLGAGSNCYAYAIDVDAAGTVYVTGCFTGAGDFDPGAGTNLLTSVQVSDIFVCKLNTSGALIWVAQLGGSDYQEGHGIVVDANGAVYTSGWFAGTVDFDPGAGTTLLSAGGPPNAYVSKLDASGNFAWASQFYANANVEAYDIALDASGNVYTAGRFIGVADFDPGAAAFSMTPTGLQDVFISKLDNAGNFVWAKQISGPNTNSWCWTLTVDISGNVLLAGVFGASTDFDPGPGVYTVPSQAGGDIFVVKLTAAGNLIWAKNFAGGSLNEAYGIATDAAGAIYVAGAYRGTTDFDPGVGVYNITAGTASATDLFVCKLDSAGGFGWAFSTGDQAQDDASCIATDAAYNVYITGTFRFSIDADPGSGVTMLLGNGFFRDPYIIKLNQLSTGTAEPNSLTKVTAYPNPTSDVLNIQLHDAENIQAIEIINSTGQVVLLRQLQFFENELLLSLDLTPYADGMYMVKLHSDDSSEVIRIVKQQ